jgi:thiosulfate reductase cytochrome b subunit
LHPTSPRRKLNPLQKITYLALLNIFLPFQILTGLLLWGADRWPQLFDKVGGLWVLAPAHTLGAYLFLAFLIGHLYLATTGTTSWGLLP